MDPNTFTLGRQEAETKTAIAAAGAETPHPFICGVCLNNNSLLQGVGQILPDSKLRKLKYAPVHYHCIAIGNFKEKREQINGINTL